MMSLVSAIFRHPSGRIGAGIIVVFLLLAGLGAVGLTPHDPLKQFVVDRLKGPSATYWFGTDLLGRDTFSRLMLGIGESFLIAFASVAIAATAGTLIGLFAAWWGHLWDGVLMRIMDVLLAFPAILLALLIVAI
jgi:peptide/nickel transport system permease protein